MDNDVFQALWRLLGQFGVEPDVAGTGVAASPFGLHPLHEEPLHLTPISGSHLAIKGGTAFLSCSRYHPSTNACLRFSSVPGRTRSSIRLCFNSTDGGWSLSMTVEQVALAPDVVAFAVQVFARGFTLLSCSFFCCCLIQPSLEMANTRMVSRLIRDGAEMRTRPVGGWTLRWTFLMSLSTTSTVMSPSLSCVTISILSVL